MLKSTPVRYPVLMLWRVQRTRKHKPCMLKSLLPQSLSTGLVRSGHLRVSICVTSSVAPREWRGMIDSRKSLFVVIYFLVPFFPKAIFCAKANPKRLIPYWIMKFTVMWCERYRWKRWWESEVVNKPPNDVLLVLLFSVLLLVAWSRIWPFCLV